MASKQTSNTISERMQNIVASTYKSYNLCTNNTTPTKIIFVFFSNP